jgi:hypothetical protein
LFQRPLRRVDSTFCRTLARKYLTPMRVEALYAADGIIVNFLQAAGTSSAAWG